MEQEIRFKYKFPEDFNPVYANGVYGGLGPQNEAVVNFFLERIPIPKEVVHNLLPDFSLGEPKPSINDGETVHVIRFVQTGVVMSFETATTVHKWLGEVISGLQPSVEGEAKNE